MHDNVTGSAHRSGTDGIHFYEGCKDILVYANTIERVGDDAISFGSFNGSKPNTGAICIRNTVRDVAGSIKLYGAVENVAIACNTVTRAANGGVTLWDDRDLSQSFDIKNVTIINNVLTDCGGPAVSGGVYLVMTKGNGIGQMRNIAILDNTIIRCKYGVTAASFVDGKKIWNLRIVGNRISDPKTGTAFFIKGLAGPAVIQDNQVSGTGIRPSSILESSIGLVRQFRNSFR